jgi:hypothetical protein
VDTLNNRKNGQLVGTSDMVDVSYFDSDTSSSNFGIYDLYANRTKSVKLPNGTIVAAEDYIYKDIKCDKMNNFKYTNLSN